MEYVIVMVIDGNIYASTINKDTPCRHALFDISSLREDMLFKHIHISSFTMTHVAYRTQVSCDQSSKVKSCDLKEIWSPRKYWVKEVERCCSKLFAAVS